MATATMTPQPSPPRISAKNRKRINIVLLTTLTAVILAIFLMPLAYGVMTSLKTEAQISSIGAPWYPASPVVYEYEGREYDVYEVPVDGNTYEWALVNKGREASEFIDPADPSAGLIPWEGRWRTLEQAWQFDPVWQNFVDAWNTINFPLLLRNTVFYAVVSTIGAVSSAALVAYGFARYDFPHKSVLFLVVMATIILPPMVTLVPTYTFFNRIGWVGSWWPLIVPQFFANGYNIFLLRQFFLGIPRALDEAAMIDGAGHFRIFWSIILPQARPALLAVTLFHFFFAWNDFFGPLIYLAGNPDLYPITVGLNGFQGLYEGQDNLIQAASLTASIIPLIVFFFAQRAFIQGVVITGVEK
ncbi:MAG: carbohydrate ABC transporter permease [Anaerolineae bacterium]|nr:carbohydrate ABC transporter permease [Anaerolineae bacterium]MCO5189804.1 carbohydrate ABC transporter permease [Anaerolineae bacterium]MCO5206898.1 carbohydrate ABC transporter permease [Anaerolineae bacterium]